MSQPSGKGRVRLAGRLMRPPYDPPFFVVLKRKPEAPRNYSKGRWSQEEISRLEKAVSIYNHDWRLVSEFVKTRSPRQCLNRYTRSPTTCHEYRNKERDLKSPSLQERWTEEEVCLLFEAVRLVGTTWEAVANFVRTRTSQQCKNKYHNLNRIR